MAKGFGGIGHCSRCGDTQGPWSLDKQYGWLCDSCAEEVEQKRDELHKALDKWDKENNIMEESNETRN